MSHTLAVTRVVFAYDVADVEPLQLRYRKSRISPERADVTVDDGLPRHVEVFGRAIKKDGTLGENGHTQWLSWRDRDEWPAWLTDLVDAAAARYAAMVEAVSDV